MEKKPNILMKEPFKENMLENHNSQQYTENILDLGQRIYITNRTEKFRVYALRKVNNRKCKKCKKGWKQQLS